MTARVLVVDDNEASRLTLCALLESEAFAVTECGCLADARKALAGPAVFDLVLLDRHLSDGQGPELIPAVRARLPSCKIIVVSGSDQRQDGAGPDSADAYFGKGEDLERLFDTIQALLTVP
jgi:CheY-like chemotaxis protein